MTILIQDTARNNLIKWTRNGIGNGYARGAFLSPFTSPRVETNFKRSADKTSTEIRNAGGEFWFDPMTYALDMPRAGDFRFYDDWELWKDGSRGDLSSNEAKKGHVKKVFKIQNDLLSPLLAPTVLVSYPDNSKSQTALELAEIAMNLQTNTWLSIAGDHEFWSASAELDAHIGALHQLEPAGWLITVTRSNNLLPPAATAEEIFGVMRTIFALSQERPVRVSFGDIAGLPAIAAGAETLGTGWDVRQRICAYHDFEKRESDPGQATWLQRPTLQGLLGSLKKSEYEVLISEKPTLSSKLTPGTIGPYMEDGFAQHAKVLTSVIQDLNSRSGQARVEYLRKEYVDATENWKTVQKTTGAKTGADKWISPFLKGLEAFMQSEGWI